MTFHDNLGKVLAGLFRAPSTGSRLVSGLIRADTGASFNTNVYHTESNTTYTWASSNPTLQYGQSGATPTRQDQTIVSPFGTAPEDSPVTNLNSGYNSGLGKITITAIPLTTGGSGTIQEYVKFATARDAIGGSTNRTIIWLRDLVSPVGFIIGQSINSDLEVLI